ncbi:arsenate reductase (glutaredoxin) [Halomonas aestuarii]|uniref:Arsenate reductase (Glutaredoxin) n=1 Tax=Halomonas aestuarii TaxID=1897729 RepID=A0A1J0VJK5_9GAMM|nr:arsenate reductase family protein [Halomonas aestuarii]APE32216.1 arsenate reductase (glutaredoxin) [Halomonas aestuarii]
MAGITLYHNPRCSKSREALALLEEAGAKVRVRRYLDEPLDAAELEALIQRLEGDLPTLVRRNETEWKQRGADADDPRQVVEALLAHPRILQRPIADDGRRAIIGRPPEAIRALLD